MEAYFDSHPGARKYSLAAIEHEELLTSLFEGRVADGRHSQGFDELMDLVNDQHEGAGTPLSESDGLESSAIEEDSESIELLDSTLLPSGQSSAIQTPSGRQAQRVLPSSTQSSANTQESAAVSSRSAIATHHARKIRDPFQDELGRGMASLVDVLASRNRSIVSAAIAIANRDFTNDLPPLQAAQLARMLTITANAEMFVGMTNPAVRAVFIKEWLGETGPSNNHEGAIQ